MHAFDILEGNVGLLRDLFAHFHLDLGRVYLKAVGNFTGKAFVPAAINLTGAETISAQIATPGSPVRGTGFSGQRYRRRQRGPQGSQGVPRRSHDGRRVGSEAWHHAHQRAQRGHRRLGCARA